MIEGPGSVTILSQPAHGTATVNPETNNVTYTAFAGFVGTDTFRYTVTDEAGAASLPATVTVLVSGPIASSGSFKINGSKGTLFLLSTPPAAPATFVSATWTINIVRPPRHGHLIVDSVTGQVTYTPNHGFHGHDSFVYSLTDPSGVVSPLATITLIVAGPPSVGVDRFR